MAGYLQYNLLTTTLSLESQSAMICQCTIDKAVAISGIGLHSGERINMTLRPAESGTGVVFHRLVGPQTVSIPARAENVVDTRLATVLGRGEVRISTVEHLLATLAAYGIDNLHIDIDGPEVPVMDGSAAPLPPCSKQPVCASFPKAGPTWRFVSRSR